MHDRRTGSASRSRLRGPACAVVAAGSLCALAGGVFASQQAKTDVDRRAISARAVREGLTIDFEVSPYHPQDPQDRTLREGDDATIGFTIRDAGSGSPVSSLNPSAWLALSGTKRDEPQASCADLVRSALGQTLSSRPAVDLNAYYVLALNADATITVVDPLSGLGGTKLLALIPLASPGDDWALTADQSRLLVTMPAARRVAIVDTRSWSVTGTLDVGRPPAGIALQPDGAYGWVADTAAATSDRESGAASGVAVVDLQTLRIAAHIATGAGRHQIAFSDDSRFAFISNADAGTVSIVDVRRLRKIRDVAVGGRVSSMAFSTLARALYLTTPDAPVITVIGLTTQDVIARIDAAPGLGVMEFAPDGRLGFAASTRANTISIVDASVNRIIRTVDLEKRPAEVAFSSRYAYIRQQDSEIVAMMPLDAAAQEGTGAVLLDFPGGQHALGGGSRTTLAPSIVRAATNGAMLVTNPQDRAIYYYQEGMAAPMGQFDNYGREPLAVRIIDRSLRETRAGRYRSTVRLPLAGKYTALLFVDSPRVVHCFDVSIAPSLRQPRASERLSTHIEPLTQETSVRPGTAIELAFRVTDGTTGKIVPDVKDAGVLIVAAGVWQMRQLLEEQRDGVYALAVTPPAPGLYDVFIVCPSRQIPYRRIFTFGVSGDAK